jgi:hypothetical protein
MINASITPGVTTTRIMILLKVKIAGGESGGG